MTAAITAAMTVAEATVRLLLTGNTTELVLAKLRETHPGHGNGNTVAFYRHHIKACRLGKPHKLPRSLAALIMNGASAVELPGAPPPGVVQPGTDSPLISILDNLDLDPEVRRRAEETVRFSEQNPEACFRSARATLVVAVRKMGAPGTLDQAIRDLENRGKISKVTATYMHTIKKIRNDVEYESATVTRDDSQTCASTLVTILKAISDGKSGSHT